MNIKKGRDVAISALFYGVLRLVRSNYHSLLRTGFLYNLPCVYAEKSTFALSFCTKNEGKMKKSWRFRKKTMRLKCLIYRHAS